MDSRSGDRSWCESETEGRIGGSGAYGVVIVVDDSRRGRSASVGVCEKIKRVGYDQVDVMA